MYGVTPSDASHSFLPMRNAMQTRRRMDESLSVVLGPLHEDLMIRHDTTHVDT